MRNPGPVVHGSPEHVAMVCLAQEMAKSFGAAEAPMLGILVKLRDKMGEAAETESGMSALAIEVVDNRLSQWIVK